MALSDTIHLLQQRERERDEREAKLDQPRMVEIWRREIGEVYDVIRAAMTGYTDSGVATFSEEDIEVEEEMLGSAVYPRLVIEIIGRRILVVPVARFIIGGTGRLDMYRANRPTEDNRALIIRGVIEPGFDPKDWLIERKGEAPSGVHGPLPGLALGRRRYHRLEPASIEAAVDYLLQLP